MPTSCSVAVDVRDTAHAFVLFYVLRASQAAPITILDAGEKQRSQSQTSDTAKGSALLDEMLSSLLLALESRLKKSKLAIIQIFVVMMSTESESAAIISTLQELKFGMEALCSENDSKTDFNYSTISTISQQDVPVSFAGVNSRRASRVQV